VVEASVVESERVSVRPLPETRFFNSFPGLLLSVVSLMALTDDQPADWLPADWVLWCGVALGVVLGLRGARMGVYFRADRVIVRGQFLSRSISTKRVVAVRDGMLPSLRWKTGQGRTLASPLLAFAHFFSTLPRYEEHRVQSLKDIRSQVGRAKRRDR
jgi:hypothetical protein